MAAVADPAPGNEKFLASSLMLTFMPCRVDSVIRCTSSAWMVAASARPFCSSQNCTAFSSAMRLSTSSTLTVGATHWGTRPRGFAAVPAPCASPCRNSKPGMNFPKPNADVSPLIVLSAAGMGTRFRACFNRHGTELTSLAAFAANKGAACALWVCASCAFTGR